MKPSIHISAIKRKIQRLEEGTPQVLQHLDGMPEGDKAVLAKWLDETLSKARASLESLQNKLNGTDDPDGPATPC